MNITLGNLGPGSRNSLEFFLFNVVLLKDSSHPFRWPRHEKLGHSLHGY